jgi:hypothetical protein
LVTLSCLVSFLLAAQWWETTDPAQWDENQCLKILLDSPWVQESSLVRMRAGISRERPLSPGDRATLNTFGGLQFAKPMKPSIGNGEFGSSSDSSGEVGIYSGGESDFAVFFRVLITSAEPVQLAINRLRNLDGPKLTEMARLEERESPRFISVQVGYFSDPPGHNSLQEFIAVFRRETAESLRSRTYLAAHGLKVMVRPEVYSPPSETVPFPVFRFPRYDASGKPYFDGSGSSILFHTELDILDRGASQTHVIDVKFKTTNMKFKSNFAI